MLKNASKYIVTQMSVKSGSQNHSEKNFQVISHRGLCSQYPENTKEGLLAGVQHGDLSELDILLTKDEEIVVFHDRILSRITNVAEFPEFEGLAREDDIDADKKLKLDWWLRDFTLPQLKKLNVRQDLAYRPQLPGVQFKISTLEEVIQAFIQEKKTKPHFGGLLVELKSEKVQRVTDRDKIMSKKLSELLRKYNLNSVEGCQEARFPIVLQSFCLEILSCLEGCSNHVVQLMYDTSPISEQYLLERRDPKLNIIGIGITTKSLLNQQGQPCRKVRQICDLLGYSLKYWTIVEDSPKPIAFGCKSYQELYRTLAEIGVTGFITEFPKSCRNALRLYCEQKQKRKYEQSARMDQDIFSPLSNKKEQAQIMKVEDHNPPRIPDQ